MERILIVVVDGDYLHVFGYTGGLTEAEANEEAFVAVVENLRFQ